MTENKYRENTLVNNSVVSFPDSDYLVNYIVAHPDEYKNSYLGTSVHIHAEKTLLNRFDTLNDEFSKSEMVSTVLFYSWLMPCSGCTQLLIKKFENSAYDVAVVYNNDWTKVVKEEENEKNRKLLRGAGIEVYQVRYQFTLPSVQSS